MIELFEWFSIIGGFIAASLWFWSALTKVSPGSNPESFDIIEDGGRKPYSIFETLKRQTKLNGCAAATTGVSVLFLAIAKVAGS